MTSMLPVFLVGVLLMLCMYSPATGSEEAAKKQCVLNDDGTEVCEPVTDLLMSVRGKNKRRYRRPKAGGSPCSKQDTLCWARKVRDYTNAVRRKYKRKMLKLGPRAQLNNAMWYASKLSKMGFLKHQNLPSVMRVVKCKRWIGGENLAYNYERGDIARACVDQWIKSKGHFENLVRPWFEEVVTAVHTDRDGRNYCVQTFGLIYEHALGTLHGKNCKSLQRR